MKPQREMSGILSKYDGQSDRAPDYKGTCMIDGQAYSISGWVKHSANGPFLSLAFDKPKETPKRHSDVGVDDIPF